MKLMLPRDFGGCGEFKWLGCIAIELSKLEAVGKARGGVPLGSSSGSACLVLGILLCLGCSVLCSPSGMQCSPELLQSGGVSVGLFGGVPAAPAVPYIN